MFYYRLLILSLMQPIAQCALSMGPFFWRPRLALDLTMPTTPLPHGPAGAALRTPDKNNIKKGLVVLIDSYAMGMTVIALAAGLTSGPSDVYMNPLSAYFYTNAYRWALRYFSNFPNWLSGKAGNFIETTKVWKRRFYYMDEFMPNWMKQILVFIPKKEWEQEVKDWKMYKKYSESAFGKFYRYPTKHFNQFLSMITEETKDVDYNQLSDSNVEYQ